MDPLTVKILSIVGLETLEKLAFIFGAYREDLGPVPEAGPFVAVQVHFEGRFSGVLELRLSEAVLPELAANMLGVDESGLVGIDQQCDALREVTNVVCGRLLPLIGGREAEFHIEPPVVLDLPSTAGGRLLSEPVAQARLDLENGVCDLSLAVNEGLPEQLPPEAIQVSEQSLEWDTL